MTLPDYAICLNHTGFLPRGMPRGEGREGHVYVKA
jgi:hypothetical protein